MFVGKQLLLNLAQVVGGVDGTKQGGDGRGHTTIIIMADSNIDII